MSSIPEPEHLYSADLATLRDVLRASVFSGIKAEAFSGAKRNASIYVQTESKKGIGVMGAILLALENRDERCRDKGGQ